MTVYRMLKERQKDAIMHIKLKREKDGKVEKKELKAVLADVYCHVPVKKPPRLTFAEIIKVCQDVTRDLPARRARGDPANYKRSRMFAQAIHEAYENPGRIQYRNVIEEEVYTGEVRI